MPAAAIYCRISKDREGAHLGVKRQEEDCRALAERLGWTVAEVLIDNDRSAYSGRTRPSYERLLAGIEAGRYAALLAWHPDRLHRSPVELERFIEVVDRHGVHVATVQAGEVDLSSPAGRMTARVVGAVARHESEHKAARAQRKHLELARAGKPAGGGKRPYGYRRVLDSTGRIDRLEIVPEEAEIVREATARLLAGESIKSVVDLLAERGVPTSTGAERFTITAFKNMITSARLAGMRVHKGEIVAEAEWPAILTLDELLKVRAAVAARATGHGSRARRYLLSGWCVCGDCGKRMGVRPAGGGRRRYQCLKDRHGCGRWGLDADKTEALVVAAAMQTLDSTDIDAVAGRLAAGDDNAASVVADVERRLEELAAMWAAGDLSMREWTAARDALTKRRDDAEERLRHSLTDTAAAELVGSGAKLLASWGELSFDQRRGVLATVVDAVVIAPPVKVGNKFDPARVSVRWKL